MENNGLPVPELVRILTGEIKEILADSGRRTLSAAYQPSLARVIAESRDLARWYTRVGQIGMRFVTLEMRGGTVTGVSGLDRAPLPAAQVPQIVVELIGQAIPRPGVRSPFACALLPGVSRLAMERWLAVAFETLWLRFGRRFVVRFEPRGDSSGLCGLIVVMTPRGR